MLSTSLPWLALIGAMLFFLWLDLKWFARDGEADVREAVTWSIGWLLLSLAMTGVVWVLNDHDAAIEYVTVYLIERTLSLDNLFVFLMLFAYFRVPVALRAKLLLWGIVAALALRAVAILGGVALLDRFGWVLYVLGGLLLVLAARIFKGVAEAEHAGDNLFVRLVRKVWPVTPAFEGHKWFVRRDRRRYVTPLFLCLTAVVFADIAFAIDSIPAAFAISRDPFVIWMGNVFALVGLRSLFVLVEGLRSRFRFLDQTIATVLGAVGVKILIEHWVHLSPVASLALVFMIFLIGFAWSVIADRREVRNGPPPGVANLEPELAGSNQNPGHHEGND